MPRIRPATPADADAMRALHTAAVRELTTDDYDADQREAWATPDADRDGFPFDDPDHHLTAAIHDEEIVGFGQLDTSEGEVIGGYVHSDHAGTGVGSAILVHHEGYALGSGLTHLHLTASMNAVAFYERHGYAVTEETVLDVSQRVEGVELPVAMMGTPLS